jgi:hypothetical protein
LSRFLRSESHCQIINIQLLNDSAQVPKENFEIFRTSLSGRSQYLSISADVTSDYRETIQSRDNPPNSAQIHFHESQFQKENANGRDLRSAETRTSTHTGWWSWRHPPEPRREYPRDYETINSTGGYVLPENSVYSTCLCCSAVRWNKFVLASASGFNHMECGLHASQT